LDAAFAAGARTGGALAVVLVRLLAWLLLRIEKLAPDAALRRLQEASATADLNAREATGPLWGAETEDPRWLAWPPGAGPSEHVNEERDVLLLVLAGSATVMVDREACVIVNLMVQYYTTVDRAFAALADPTRRAVLERLGAGSATISELAEPFGMSLTGMKKHVRLLEEAELVTTEKVGRVRRCMLMPYAFEGISTWVQRLDRFGQVVERTKGER
jgi:DNA-binding transcriptional ArsR family regulator